MTGRAAPITIAILLAAAVGGCGDARTAPPNVSRPAVPSGSTPHDYASLGLEFRSAANWSYETGRLPLVAMMSSGQAVVSIWRYPRSQVLPHGLAQLRRARHALVTAAHARDPTFVAAGGRIVKIDGQPAIDLTGHETVQGQPRLLRSVHVYAHGAEYVVDALAPAAYFAAADASLFVPLLETLRFPAPIVGAAAQR